MKMKMIILHAELRRSDTELAASTSSNGKVPANARVTVEELTTKERDDLRRDASVLAAAPPMPMSLIGSMESSTTGTAKPPSVSWGIGAVRAGSSPYSGKGVTVAVLDTGIARGHPAFSGIDIVTENFTEDPPEDVDGHGTHCCGTICGRDVDGSRIGVARGVTRVLAGKVIGGKGGSTAAIVKAIYWARKEGAHIISMSLGMDFAGYQEVLMREYGLPAKQATSLALAGYRDNVRLFDKISDAVKGQASLDPGVVVVAAAGNESNRPKYSITVAPPAAAECFISVGALAVPRGTPKLYEMASFSNDGAMLAGPGEDIWSAQANGTLVAKSGTSMATPHVAGVAALWAEKAIADGRFSAEKVIEDLTANALGLGSKIDANDVRHGLVQAPQKKGDGRGKRN